MPLQALRSPVGAGFEFTARGRIRGQDGARMGYGTTALDWSEGRRLGVGLSEEDGGGVDLFRGRRGRRPYWMHSPLGSGFGALNAGR